MENIELYKCYNEEEFIMCQKYFMKKHYKWTYDMIIKYSDLNIGYLFKRESRVTYLHINHDKYSINFTNEPFNDLPVIEFRTKLREIKLNNILN